MKSELKEDVTLDLLTSVIFQIEDSKLEKECR